MHYKKLSYIRNISLISLFFVITTVYSETNSDRAARIEKTVISGTASEIKNLLSDDADAAITLLGDQQDTLLMTAAKNNREAGIMAILLKAGIDPAKKNRQGVTALMYACQYTTDPSIVEQLVTTGTLFAFSRKNRILSTDNEGKTAFDYAKTNNTAEQTIIEILSRYAQEPVTTTETPEQTETTVPPPAVEPVAEVAATADTPTTAAPVPVTSKDKPVPAVQPYEKIYLFDYNGLTDSDTLQLPSDTVPDPSAPVFIQGANERDNHGATKLMLAAKEGNMRQIQNLLYSGADVQAADNDGWTALMYAVRYQINPDVTNIFLKNGAVITTRNSYGLSALDLAAGFSSNQQIVLILLDNIAITEEEKRSAFMYAVTCGASPAVLQLFIDRGIPVDMAWKGRTPLMNAASTNTDTTTIAWLLEHGAKPGYMTLDGKTAFDFARENTRLPHDTTYWKLNGEPVEKGAH